VGIGRIQDEPHVMQQSARTPWTKIAQDASGLFYLPIEKNSGTEQDWAGYWIVNPITAPMMLLWKSMLAKKEKSYNCELHEEHDWLLLADRRQ